MTQTATTLGLQRIDLDDPTDVQKWIDQYGCSEEQLRAAVKDVGSQAQEVREHIAKQAKDAIKHATE